MDQALKEDGMLASIFFTTSLGKAIRARKLLGWHPTRPSVVEDMVNGITLEAEAGSVGKKSD